MRGENIKDLLAEMKDLSVLAVDLAYCSIFFNNKDIAKEVKKIASKMDLLREKTERSVLRAAKSEDEDKLIGLLRTGAYAERIANITAQMADIVLKGKIHEIGKKAFGEGEEKFSMFKVSEEFHERKISEIGDIYNVWIIALKRKRWIYHPP